MFTGLKNKIKEETGGDVGKIVELVSATLTKPSRHSRHGSNASLGSFSIDGSKDDVGTALPVADIKLSDGRALTAKEFKKLESKEDEWRRKLQKRDEECRKKLEDKDRELQKVLEKKELENSALLSEIRELQSTVKKLEDEVKLNSEYKSRLCQYQEDLDQMEGFQSQEMAKVKHLLLQKEQLLAEKEATISQQSQKVGELTAEVRRLQEAERSLADAQELTKQESASEELTTLKSQCSSLTDELVAERANSAALDGQLAELQTVSQADRREKDELLMRNAQVSQEVELVRQELRSVQKEADDMHARMGKLQAAVREQDEMLGRERIEKDILARRVADLETAETQQKTVGDDVDELRKRTADLEVQLLEKNKMLKNLQQRLSEMKKTMAKELKVTTRSIDPGGEGCIPPHGPALLTPLAQPPSPTLDPHDINFKYLKHVLFKFLTCREYEAQHLTRAVSTLLRFTAEEERLLRDTLYWRSSWFGSRPTITGGTFS